MDERERDDLRGDGYRPGSACGLDRDDALQAFDGEEDDRHGQQPAIWYWVGARLLGETWVGQRILGLQRYALLADPSGIPLSQLAREVTPTARRRAVCRAQQQLAGGLVEEEDHAQVGVQFLGDGVCDGVEFPIDMLRGVGDAIHPLQRLEPVVGGIRPLESIMSVLVTTNQRPRDLEARMSQRLLCGERPLALCGERPLALTGQRLIEDRGKEIAPALKIIQALI